MSSKDSEDMEELCIGFKTIAAKLWNIKDNQMPVTCNKNECRRFFVLLFCMICYCSIHMDYVCHAATEEKLELYATCAALIDWESGRVLYGKKDCEPMSNASTTKVMTCIIVLENCSQDERVTISSYAASMPKVNCGLKCGESYTVKDLLYSMMLESHNDSAVALAEHIGKQLTSDLHDKEEKDFSQEESKEALKAFYTLMNAKAKSIGCEDTFFITPNGLDATVTVTTEDGKTYELEHHTTAKDLARILAYCILKSPNKQDYLKITQASAHSFSANGRNLHLQNHNAFLTMMEGAISGKTGFTGKAGYCYVGALQKDGRVFVVSLLACGWPNNRNYKWKDMRKLMEYGLSNYRRVEFEKDGVLIREKDLPKVIIAQGQGQFIGETVSLSGCIKIQKMTERDFEGFLVSADEKVETRILLPKELTAPVKEGQRIGEIQYMIGEEVLLTEEIVSDRDIKKIDFVWCFLQVCRLFCL